MIRIRTGDVVRGEEHEPLYRNRVVGISDEFWLSDREITVRMFLEFFNDTGYEFEKPAELQLRAQEGDGDLEYPVKEVSWYDAVMFCNWLSRKKGFAPCYERQGKEQSLGVFTNEPIVHDAGSLVAGTVGYRLPTENEWEYACRARTTTLYFPGNDETLLKQYAVYIKNSTSGPSAVGSKFCNTWGLFDMHGNVAEWCQELSSHDSPERVNSSGDWDSPALYCRSAFRSCFPPHIRNRSLGFRVARGPVIIERGNHPEGGAIDYLRKTPIEEVPTEEVPTEEVEFLNGEIH